MKQHGKHALLWARARRLFIKNNPERICAVCDSDYEINDIDHIKTRGSHPELRYDQSNLRWICGSCHKLKHP